jgi:tetratricopeptide (TPR) repeat protein
MTLDDSAHEKAGRGSKARVFISYSRKDLAFADRLEAALEARGFEPLIDRAEIYAFEEWWTRIEKLIASADTVVFVLSPDAIASQVALKEVDFAASLNKRLAPIVCRPVNDKAVPEALAKLNFIVFDDPARFDESADRLAEALATDIGWIRQHTEFGEQARRWTAAKTPNGLLLRSPVLEYAERWIAARPPGAPAPTAETQLFITRSRQGATRRRNALTGSLAVGLAIALALAALAYWQRDVAQRNEAQAKTERDNAIRNFKLAQKTAEGLVFDIAQSLRDVQGMSAEAVRKILETARRTLDQLATASPDDLPLQHSRAVMLREFGDTYMTLGDLEQALTVYRDSLTILERLVSTDPSNAGWQSEIPISLDAIGDVLVEQGKLDEALETYRNGLAIRQRLAADPSDIQRQSDLSFSYDRVGSVLLAQGKLDEALEVYRRARAIRLRAILADRSNVGWQRDLSVAYENIGDVLAAQGKAGEAFEVYRDSLIIRQNLAATNPGNTGWQRDLSVAYEKVGNMLVAQDNLDEGLTNYRESLAIRERLAAADPGNTTWQRDRSPTTGSATCWWRKAGSRRRSRATATPSPSQNVSLQSTSATPAGSATWWSPTAGSATC